MSLVAVSNLKARFPDLGEQRIRDALDKCNGHAGRAASDLRQVVSDESCRRASETSRLMSENKSQDDSKHSHAGLAASALRQVDSDQSCRRTSETSRLMSANKSQEASKHSPALPHPPANASFQGAASASALNQRSLMWSTRRGICVRSSTRTATAGSVCPGAISYS